VYLAYPPELDELRERLRAYFRTLLTDEELAGHPIESPERYAQVRMQLGRDGWLGIGWPVEYGGQGRSELHQFVFFDEAKRAGAPVPMMALNTVGPTLMRHGTREQKLRYLPGILSGEIDFAVGYTEPEAGTDLAALRTTAVRHGDHYVVNGQKVFTSGGAHSDYIWLAARTDADAPRHEGLSILVVPCTAAGFRATSLATVAEGGVRETTTTYYDDVKVPVGNRVGPENRGWHLITSQLNHERVALAASRGWVTAIVDEVREWAAQTPDPAGGTVSEQGWVRQTLARVDARLEAMKLFNWRVAATLAAGEELGAAESAVTKIYGTEVLVEACRLLQEVLGRAGYLTAGAPGAALDGRLERAYREATVGTFAGGTNDVLRQMIATKALGLRRAAG